MRWIYLHGFASGPTSSKARWFQQQFAAQGLTLEVPALDSGNFETLTITGQFTLLEQLGAGEPLSLIGSSMGGYLAALYASRHPEAERLVLLAPAFGFAQTWSDYLGPEGRAKWKAARTTPVYHYTQGRECALQYGLLEDALQWEGAPSFAQPALIFHGSNDDVVLPQVSRDFAARHPNVVLRVLKSDHQLTDVLEEMWREILPFLRNR